MTFPEENRYTSEHEWARQEGEVVTIGITAYATDQLGDVVFVELPEVGRTIEVGKTFGVVEAVKTVSDLYAPLSGEVVAVNAALGDSPNSVNQDPYGEGWMIRVKPSDPSAYAKLMNHVDYEKFVEEHHA